MAKHQTNAETTAETNVEPTEDATNTPEEVRRSAGRPPKDKPRFKIKSALVLPTYSIKDWPAGKELYARIEGEMETREQTDKDGKPRMENGEVLHISSVPITDLETGEQGMMVVPFLVRKAFEKIEGPLAGHAFRIVKGRKVNRTNEFSVHEIELETDGE